MIDNLIIIGLFLVIAGALAYLAWFKPDVFSKSGNKLRVSEDSALWWGRIVNTGGFLFLLVLFLHELMLVLAK